MSTSPISKVRAADDERRQAKRNSLADKLMVEAKALAELKIEKATVEGVRRTVEADLGPVKYLATLIGATDQDVLRWFILAVALLLDPAAVLLLLASTRQSIHLQAPRLTAIPWTAPWPVVRRRRPSDASHPQPDSYRLSASERYGPLRVNLARASKYLFEGHFDPLARECVDECETITIS